MDFDTYVQNGLDQLPPPTMNNRSGNDMDFSAALRADRQYNPCPEARPSDGILAGSFQRFPDWNESSIYPGTSRAVSIYCSPEFSSSDEPPWLAFFNDGDGYLWREGDVRATYVFDSMHANGEIKRIVAIFVNPGTSAEHEDQRSIEYDTISSRFVEFIDQEIVPFVEDKVNTKMSADPLRRLICGISSGGICAFNAAWHAPSSFGLVLSHCGSFTNIRGGHNYPSMVRRNPRKPIRVFLQSGQHDLNTIPGDWTIGNKDMASALEFAGYESRFVFGEGGHSLCHGGAIFADSLRWLYQIDQPDSP